MNNEDRLKTAFSNALGVEEKRLNDNLEYNTISEWDSISHMALISELETAFNIMLNTEDIINMNSVGRAKEIISAHGVVFAQTEA